MFGNIIAVLSWHVDVCDYQIRACCESLRATLEGKAGGISIHPLYGDLPFEEQERAILPSAKRKIVLATNIAETSLTIEGVKVVIDSGLTRRLQHDPATGMNRLVTVAVSNAAAEQRKGWAGRLGPGICYRIYSRHAFQGMIPFTPPEMLLADLSHSFNVVRAIGTLYHTWPYATKPVSAVRTLPILPAAIAPRLKESKSGRESPIKFFCDSLRLRIFFRLRPFVTFVLFVVNPPPLSSPDNGGG